MYVVTCPVCDDIVDVLGNGAVTVLAAIIPGTAIIPVDNIFNIIIIILIF